MANTVPKTPPASWIDIAQKALIEDGIHGVKVDRLAQRLGVTRGGFYKHFVDRGDLLDRLLRKWETENLFAVDGPQPRSPREARDALAQLTDRLINEDGFDPRFDLAIRDWARNEKRAAWAVERVDAKRLELLRRLFAAMGCEGDEAAVRARIYYYHQIGYYSMGIKQPVAERKKLVPTYLRILVGSEHFDDAAAGEPASRPRGAPRAATLKRASSRRG